MSKTMQAAGMYMVVVGRVVEGDFIIKTHNRRVSCLSNVYNIILLLRPDSYRRCTDKYNYPPEYTPGYIMAVYILL